MPRKRSRPQCRATMSPWRRTMPPHSRARTETGQFWKLWDELWGNKCHLQGHFTLRFGSSRVEHTDRRCMACGPGWQKVHCIEQRMTRSMFCCSQPPPSACASRFSDPEATTITASAPGTFSCPGLRADDGHSLELQMEMGKPQSRMRSN